MAPLVAWSRGLGRDVVRCAFLAGSGIRRITLAGVDCPPGTAGDVVFPLATRMAAERGRPVAIATPVAPSLSRSLAHNQQELRRVYPDTRATPLLARRRAPVEATADRGTAAFFSGGLDSFHLALRDRDHLDALLFVHGFDIALGNRALRDVVRRRVQEAAAALDLPVHEIETDIRSWSDGRADWTGYASAAIEAVGLSVAGRYRAVYYAASVADRDLPTLDIVPTRTEVVRVERRDGDRTRPEKLAAVADHPAVRRHLRVCWENPGGAYNCGRCEKCTRTLVNLAVIGALGRIETLPATLDPSRVRALPASRRSDRSFLRENLAVAEARGEAAVANLLAEVLDAAGGAA